MTGNDAQAFDRSVLADERFQYNYALDPRLPGRRRINRIDLMHQVGML